MLLSSNGSRGDLVSMSGLTMSLWAGAFRGLRHELQQQTGKLLRLLLLHPVAGAVDQMTADHAGARGRLHRLEYAGALVSAPVLFARDEAAGHVDAAARTGFEFDGE